MYARCVEHGGRKYDILYGPDDSLACAFAAGGSGAIGLCWSFLGNTGNSIYEAIQKVGAVTILESVSDLGFNNCVNQGDLATAQKHQRLMGEVMRILADGR